MVRYLKRLVKRLTSLRVSVRFDQADSSEQNVACAHFEIVGLEGIRSQYLAHWPSIHRRVHQIVQMIIRRHLKADEEFSLASPDSYIISFHRPVAEASHCANTIRAAVMDVFLLDLKLKDIGFNVSMAAPASPLHSPVAAAAAGAVADSAQQKKKYIRASVDAAHILPAEPRMRSDHAMRPMLMRDDDGVPVLPRGIDIVFSPITTLADNSRTCFAAFARLDLGGQLLYGYDVLPVEAEDDMILDLDIRTVESVVRAMERMEKMNGYPSKVLCPVHYRTIADPARREIYLQAFSELQKRGYDRVTAMQLNHMPRALYGNELRQPIEILAQLSSRVVVMQPLDWTSTGEVAAAGARAVGVDFQDLGALAPEVAHARMRAFIKQANREKLPPFVFAVTGALKDFAAGAGFSHLCDCEVPPILPALPHRPPAPTIAHDGAA